jgi:hypothetical protein
MPAMKPQLRSDDESVHAVTDNHHAMQAGIGATLFERAMIAIKLDAQHGSGFPDGQAGRVKEKPNLTAFANLGIGQQVVKGLGPSLRAREQAVDKHDGNLIWIVAQESVRA